MSGHHRKASTAGGEAWRKLNPIVRGSHDFDSFQMGFEAASLFATGTELLVCQDIGKRQDIGLRKYGVAVEANPLNLRQWLQHAYEETLDQAIYLRRAMDEMDAKGQP